nr:dihydrofolate reductase [Actinomycetota bacterium]
MSSGGGSGLPWHDRIIADISVSLDGLVTGPDPGPDNGLGIGGDALHT